MKSKSDLVIDKLLNNKIRVFLSQPMSGMPRKYVLKTREAMKEAVLDYYNREKVIEFVSAYENTIDDKVFTHDYSENICYLSKAIHMMKDVDAVAFAHNIFSSRGCVVELTIAKMYDIKQLHCERVFKKNKPDETKYVINGEKEYLIESRLNPRGCPFRTNPMIDDGK